MSKKTKINRLRAKSLKKDRHRNFYWEIRYRGSGARKMRGDLLRLANRRIARYRSKVDINVIIHFVPVKKWAGVFLTTKKRSRND